MDLHGKIRRLAPLAHHEHICITFDLFKHFEKITLAHGGFDHCHTVAKNDFLGVVQNRAAMGDGKFGALPF